MFFFSTVPTLYFSHTLFGQAKPCKSLWVSGVGPSVTKETLEAEFLKFGEIEEFKFLRDRNTAYIDYLRLEDASQALKVMNGKQIGGNQIRVDFLRSQTIRRVSQLSQITFFGIALEYVLIACFTDLLFLFIFALGMPLVDVIFLSLLTISFVV